MVGVPVGKIDSIEPRAGDVKITMSVDDDVKVPADARAHHRRRRTWWRRASFSSPRPSMPACRLAAARRWPTAATIGLDRTGVPVEWDEVKEQLTKLSAQLGPPSGGLQGPLSQFVDQAATTFDGNGDSFRNALRELSADRRPSR